MALAYTVQEAAEMLRVSTGHLYRMVRADKVKALHVGRAVRISQAELDRLCGVEPNRNGAKTEMVH